MDNNINNINNYNQLANPFLHSVQYYWNGIGSTLDMVMNRDEVHDHMDQGFELTLRDAVTAASDCSHYYGQVIYSGHDRDIYDIYIDAETRFYNLLNVLIVNNLFLNNLQTEVRDSIDMGTRYFDRFLLAIDIIDQ